MAMTHDVCFCDGEGGLERQSAVSRRAVLGGALAGVVGWMTPASAIGSVTVETGPPTDGPVLVVVFLRGGADGLGLVQPFGDRAFRGLRPTLGLPDPGRESGALVRLDDFFGLHPAMDVWREHYESERLAVFHAIGSGDTTHSHFEAMSTMERGRAMQGGESGGWLARTLRAVPGGKSPLRAVAVGAMLPESLSGANGAMSLNAISEFRLSQSDPRIAQALTSLYGSGEDVLTAAGRETLRVLDLLNGLDPAKMTNRVTFDENGFAQSMKQASLLIQAGVGVEVVTVDSYGWDTHVAQGTREGWLPTLARDVARGIHQFWEDLGEHQKRVTVVVQSEFGRRASENSGFGTDHGTGGVAFALGTGVRGGRVYADWPGLGPDQLTGWGDLKVTTDYRNLLADAVETRLGLRAFDRVFPDLERKATQAFASG